MGNRPMKWIVLAAVLGHGVSCGRPSPDGARERREETLVESFQYTAPRSTVIAELGVLLEQQGYELESATPDAKGMLASRWTREDDRLTRITARFVPGTQGRYRLHLHRVERDPDANADEEPPPPTGKADAGAAAAVAEPPPPTRKILERSRLVSWEWELIQAAEPTGAASIDEAGHLAAEATAEQNRRDGCNQR